LSSFNLFKFSIIRSFGLFAATVIAQTTNKTTLNEKKNVLEK